MISIAGSWESVLTISELEEDGLGGAAITTPWDEEEGTNTCQHQWLCCRPLGGGHLHSLSHSFPERFAAGV